MHWSKIFKTSLRLKTGIKTIISVIWRKKVWDWDLCFKLRTKISICRLSAIDIKLSLVSRSKLKLLIFSSSKEICLKNAVLKTHPIAVRLSSQFYINLKSHWNTNYKMITRIYRIDRSIDRSKKMEFTNLFSCKFLKLAGICVTFYFILLLKQATKNTCDLSTCVRYLIELFVRWTLHLNAYLWNDCERIWF